MKFKQAEEESTKSAQNYINSKKKQWKKGKKYSTGITSAKTGFTGGTGDQETLGKQEKTFKAES